jgi:hypothetical protein
MARSIIATRGYKVGAIIDKATSDKLDTDFMQPLLESYSALVKDVNNASVFTDRKTLNAVLDSVYAGVNELADRLSKLDAGGVSDWKADVLSAQAQLNSLANHFAVYSDDSNRKALYSSFVGVGLGALTGYLVYRRKKSRKWAFFAGSAATAIGGFSTWAIAKPTFE